MQITQVTKTIYTSPSGYTLEFGQRGNAIVKDKDGYDVSVIGKSNPALTEIYELIKFGQQHQAHQLGTPAHDTEE